MSHPMPDTADRLSRAAAYEALAREHGAIETISEMV